MRLLADENIPLESVRALRAAGHDVVSASESGPGQPDASHLDRSIAEDRLIVTFAVISENSSPEGRSDHRLAFSCYA